MASYDGEFFLDSYSPWSDVSSQLSYLLEVVSPAIKIQEAKDPIDEEDPRPTRFTWKYISTYWKLKSKLHELKKSLINYKD